MGKGAVRRNIVPKELPHGGCDVRTSGDLVELLFIRSIMVFLLNIPDEIPSGASGLRASSPAFRDPSDLLDSPGFSPSLGSSGRKALSSFLRLETTPEGHSKLWSLTFNLSGSR